MANSGTAEVSRHLKIDLQRPRPTVMPRVEVAFDIVGLIDCGIVDQYVDATLPGERLVPQSLGLTRFGEIGGDRQRTLWTRFFGEARRRLVARTIM